jgi:spermidine synthase
LLVILLYPSTRSDTLPSVVTKHGARYDLVAYYDSFYGSLKVVDFRDREHHMRDMVIDGAVQGSMDMHSGQPIETYAYFMALLPIALNPQMDSALVIGLGAGLVPNLLERKGIRTDVVDIDPAVLDFADRYFDLQVSGRKVVQDARYFLQSSTESYDLIVLDAFSADATPGHLVSLEALRLAEQRIADNGILVLNLIDDLAPDGGFVTASVVKTLQQVFDQVQVYPTVDLEQTSGIANVVLLAFQGEERFPDINLISESDINHYVRQRVMENIVRRFEFPDNTPAIILTDDYNPIDVLDAAVRKEMRQQILEYTQWDILGYSG